MVLTRGLIYFLPLPVPASICYTVNRHRVIPEFIESDNLSTYGVYRLESAGIWPVVVLKVARVTGAACLYAARFLHPLYWNTTTYSGHIRFVQTLSEVLQSSSSVDMVVLYRVGTHQIRRRRRAARSSTSQGRAEPLCARITGLNREVSEGKADV